jgi:outer membrane protein W
MQMIARISAMVAVGALLGSSAWAQDHRFEVSGSAGYTLSDGVTTDVAVRGGDGNIYNAIEPKDSASWGLTFGYFVTENWEIEFLYDQQMSKLQAAGTATREIGDFSVKNYHGIASYNFGDSDAKARPYVFLGAGATSFPGVDFTAANGQSREIGGNTKFSSTFGLGVKVYPAKRAGLRLQARWTPTYIKSDSEGWWCDPYWGCYVVGDPQYSNQFEFTGGITLRF